MKICFFMKKSVLFICILASFVGIFLGGSAAVGVFQVKNRSIPLYSVERDDSKICVTFNCAWGNEDIDSILNTLDTYNCRSTFFIVGEWAKKHPDDVKKIKERGHEIGTHSFDHRDYTKLSTAEIEDDIKKGDASIFEITKETPHLVRVPSGAYNSDVINQLESLGKICIQWSRDSLDYNNSTPDEIYKRAVEKTANGDIILFHTGTPNTAVALPRVLDSLSARFTPVTVSELMYEDNFYIDTTGRMYTRE